MVDPVDLLRPGLASRYRLGAEIGRGGMATVYRADDLVSGLPVAVKVLRGELASVLGPLGPQRFLREAEIVGRFQHPNIVPLLDSGEVDGAMYLVMPFVEGETLRQRIRRELQLPVAEAVRIAGQIAEGLRYAHEFGIVHRDIKPENILLEQDRVVITDFGIAKVIGSIGQETLSTTGLALGTPTYMSPEQSSGAGSVDGRSDIYSLGCVLYEMLAGEPPFTGATPQAVAARHMVEAPPALRVVRPSLGEGLQSAIETALAKAPADRFQTVAEFQRALTSGEQSGARPTGGARQRTTRRNAQIAGVGLAIVAGSLAIVVASTGKPTLSDSRYYIGPFTMGTTERVTDVGPWMLQGLADWSGIDPISQPRSRPGDIDSRSLDVMTQTAREAGARHLILGRLREHADSTILTGMKFDVGGARRLVRQATLRRIGPVTAEHATHLLDSLLTPPQARLAPDAARSSRLVPALEAFARGQLEVGRWQLAAADSEFVTATKIDPDYAQAQLWLGLVRYWQGQPAAAWKQAATQAGTDSVRLGRVDSRRALALQAQANDGAATACPGWRAAVDADSLEFPGWYSLAKCLGDDHVVIRDRASPSGRRFRGGYHESTQAYLRAFRLLPAIYNSLSGSAFRPLRQLLFTSLADLRPGDAMAPDSGAFLGYPELVGDTIAVVPYPERSVLDVKTPAFGRLHHAAVRYQRNLFKDISVAWSTMDPASVEARLARAVALDLTQDPAAVEAIAQARRAARSPVDVLRAGTIEVWMRIRGSVPDDSAGVLSARRLADSLVARFGADSLLEPESVLSLLLLTGRVHEAAALARRGRVSELMGVPRPLGREALPLLIYAAAGGPADSLTVQGERFERALSALAGTASPGQIMAYRLALLGRAATLAFPDFKMPALRELAGKGDYLLDAQALIAAGDTAKAYADLVAVLHRTPSTPAERPLDAALPEARVMALAGAREEAAAWLRPVLQALPLAPAHTFADPTRAASLVPALRFAATLIRGAEARRLGMIADLLWGRTVEGHQ